MRNRVSELRRQAHMTQEDLARRLGVSRQTVNAIENERYNPSLVLGLKMARLLEQPVDQLFILEENDTE
ncbi:MAG TPA: helix-turn-helix transcriptional regulator [Chloroflexota bacterium]|nr:helix-turn-helix transcriptional regulator [Chloroflexota bacterium]